MVIYFLLTHLKVVLKGMKKSPIYNAQVLNNTYLKCPNQTRAKLLYKHSIQYRISPLVLVVNSYNVKTGGSLPSMKFKY